MPNTTLAESLIRALPKGMPWLFNPYTENCPHETPANSPADRVERLALHLDCQPYFILVGEAPGYQGCRYSGVAFTSERLLMEGGIPRIPAPQGRLSTRELPFSEPSATIIWKTLYRLGIAECTIMWNALQLHPYRPDTPWSNRTPTPQEVTRGAPALRILLDVFPRARVIAVGQKAHFLMESMGIMGAATVRHPARGGAVSFAEGLKALVDRV